MPGICILPFMTYRDELQRNPQRSGVRGGKYFRRLTQQGFVVKFLFTAYSKNVGTVVMAPLTLWGSFESVHVTKRHFSNKDSINTNNVVAQVLRETAQSLGGTREMPVV